MGGAEESISLEENLKKALTELLILQLLSQRAAYIGELTAELSRRSGGVLSIAFPYGAIYRLEQAGHIAEFGKRHAPDGRRRQYYRITENGKHYLSQLLVIYHRFSGGVAAVLNGGEFEYEWASKKIPLPVVETSDLLSDEQKAADVFIPSPAGGLP